MKFIKSFLVPVSIILFFSVTPTEAQDVDFDAETGWVDGTAYDGNPGFDNIYENGNFRFTDDAGADWFENTSITGSNAIASEAGGAGTITIETIDGTEFDFQSFLTESLVGGDEIGQIEGFRDGVSTGN